MTRFRCEPPRVRASLVGRLGALLLPAWLLAGCGTATTEFLDEDFQQLDIDRVTILPVHDLRSDRKLSMQVAPDVETLIEEIVAYKHYVVERSDETDYLELNGLPDYGVTRAQAERPSAQWIRSIEPRYANWVMLPVLEKGYFVDDPQSHVTIGLKAYLFDTREGRIVWQDAVERTYLDEKLSRERMDSTMLAVMRTLMRSLPRHVDVQNAEPLLKPHVYDVAVAEVLPVPIPGANNDTVIRILHDSIDDNTRVALKYTPYGDSGAALAEAPDVGWSADDIARPLAESVIAIGRLAEVDAVMAFSMTLSSSQFRGDVYMVDVNRRIWYHRSADFSAISITQRVPRMQQTSDLVLQDFVNAADRFANPD